MIERNYQVPEELDLGCSVYLKNHVFSVCEKNHYSDKLSTYKINGHLVHYDGDQINVLFVLSMLCGEIFTVKESDLMTIDQAKEYIKNDQEEKFNEIFNINEV